MRQWFPGAALFDRTPTTAFRNGHRVVLSVAPDARRPYLVVMGVSGAGKSVLGRRLAAVLEVPFVEGDDFHAAQNIEKMHQGIALTDADRSQWLHALAAQIGAAYTRNTGIVVACSALKRSYRDILRTGAPELRFVALTPAEAALRRRLTARTNHFMPASLLDSQLAALELPTSDERALIVDSEAGEDQTLATVLRNLSLS